MTTIPLAPRPVALRPLSLPTEHGAWGFLLEPIALGMFVAPSRSGALIAAAAVLAFFAHQPLRLALQDAVRRRVYPRTPYCWLIAAAYLIAASPVLAIYPPVLLIIAASFAFVQLFFDAHNCSRELVAELSGAVAMSSLAAAIAIRGGLSTATALGLAGIVAARALPSIVYVRALLRGGRKRPVIIAHALAVVVVALYASPFAIVAMIVLLLRAIWGVTHEPPRARLVGWREIAFGATTVILAAIGFVR